jgi:serine/threonine protein kinase/tetratricopeptide (TPR) repeat protein
MPADPAAVKALFLEAVAVEDPAARAALVAERCGDDAELLARVSALLAANDRDLAGEGTASTGGAPEPAAVDPGGGEAAGEVIADKYTLVEVIGEGGMGLVWRARQTEPVKRYVAVKLIKAGMDSRQVLARFEAERQALALMDHPHIAKVLDGGLHGHRPYFVMELVKGVPITAYCDHHKLTPAQRLQLFVPVCQAIQHAHQKGVIHRDIKPSNVLVALYDDKPVPKVIDFGVAKATGAALTERTIDTGFGGIVGSPQYMSPEQATFNNLDIDTRSDVYALGVLLYELLTGSPPFARKELEKKGLLEMLRVVREEEPPRPSTKLSTAEALPTLSANRGTEPKKLTGLLRSELDWIVMKALEKDRSRRYETANGFAADVQRYLTGEAVQAHPPGAAYRVKKFVRRHRPQVVAAGLVLVALVAGIAGTTWGLVRATRAAEEERRAKEREAERAEGERLAKLDAEERRKQAERNLAFAKKGNEILGSVFAGLDPRKIAESGRPLQDVLRENLAKAVRELEGPAVGDPLDGAAMEFILGSSLLGLGEAELAVDVFGKVLKTRKARLGPDHPATLNAMTNLSMAYQDIGKLDRTLSLSGEALRLSKARLGLDHPHTLSAMFNCAEAYRASGKLDLALPLFEEALRRTKAKLGPDHPGTLNAMNNLATAYRDIGKLDRALPLLEEALRLKKASLGPDHPHTLRTMGNLAECYRASGKLDLALPLFEERLRLTKAKLGPDHPDTLAAMNYLALAYRETGKLDRALPLLEEALRRTKASLGPDHLHTLHTMSSLADAYRVSGKLDLALPLFEEVLRLTKAKLGPDHPDTLNATNTLAVGYFDAGKLDRTLSLSEEVLRLTKAKLGPDHLEALRALSNLAGVYRATGKPDRALPLLEEAATGVEKRDFRYEHARTIVRNTVGAYEAARQFDRADDWRRKWLAFLRRDGKGDTPAYAAELAQWGQGLLQRRTWSDAEPVLRECLALRQKSQPEAWSTFNTQSMLGGSLLGQKKYAEAEPLLLQGYERMKAREKTIPPAGAARIPEALDRLIELYTSTNKPDEAKKWQAERAKYPAPKEVGPPPQERK